MRYLFLTLLFLFLLCTGVRAETVVCDDPVHPDLAALIALYNAADGPNWPFSLGWDSGAAGSSCDPCNFIDPGQTWSGVFCTNGRVTGLNLIQNSLTGTIPSQLGQLTELKTLRLDKNDLSGSIPASLGNLSKLEGLSLSENNLSGTLPQELWQLTSLKDLILGDNNLSGFVSANIGLLQQLVELDLRRNNFNGLLPGSVGNLFRLKFLFVQENNFGGLLPDFRNAVRLEMLMAHVNAFTGSLPSMPDETPSPIRIMSLFSNKLSGGISGSYNPARMPDLVTIRLDNNELTGSLPTSWGTFDDLETIGLIGNNFTGPLPESWGDAGNALVSVNVSSNQLTGCYPTNYTKFCTTPPGFNPSSFSGNVGLPDGGSSTYFNNEFCNDGLACASNCHPDFEALIDFYDATGGPLWSTNVGWRDGKARTDCNVCDWAGVTCANGRVTEIDLNRNGLRGNLPIITELSELEKLNLYGNSFTGSIPTALINKAGLRELELHDNELTGVIPSLNNLLTMERLDFSGNDFSGGLPKVNNLPALTHLTIQEAGLAGNVPTSYNATNLPSIQWLSLFDNDLSGPLPVVLSELTTLTVMSLGRNQFSGCYPTEYSSLCGLTLVLFTDNPMLPDAGSEVSFKDRFCDYDVACEADCPPELEILDFNDLVDFANIWPNCKELPGNLTVENLIDSFGNITNLRQLTRVGGTITYRNNQSSRLRGIENVTYCAGLTIEDWSSLSNLGASGSNSAFALDSINGPFILKNLPNLTAIDKLGTATYIKSIQVENTGLLTINPLAGAEGVTDLTVINNDDMEAIYYGQYQRRAVAIGPLTNLTVSDNADLTGLYGIPAPKVTNSITITSNPLLSGCDAGALCSGLAESGATVDISGNATGCENELAVRTSCGLLPVSWLSFTASVATKTVDLNWTTAAEENNDHFAVERSPDGQRWTVIGSVSAREANLEGLHEYSYSDENPVSGESYYRLRQVGQDGAEDLSVVRRVFFSGNQSSVFPNPADESFTVVVNQDQELTLHSADGRVVRTVQHSGARTQVQREGLKSGVYWLRFAASGEVIRVIFN